VNVLIHRKFIAEAHLAQVDLLVFPELSLCGYELPLLQDCLLHPTDSRLAGIRDMATDLQMTVVVGAPVACGAGVAPAIASITFFPDGAHAVYLKQHLHPSEEVFATAVCAPSRRDDLLGESFSLAICADITHDTHAEHVAMTGASLYLAGVLVSHAGYAADAAKMQQHASHLNLGVLMANHGGPSGPYVSAGKSAFWAPGGNLVVQAPGPGNVLVVATKQSGDWTGEIISVED
jgi:predicted amidohydrolase